MGKFELLEELRLYEGLIQPYILISFFFSIGKLFHSVLVKGYIGSVLGTPISGPRYSELGNTESRGAGLARRGVSLLSSDVVLVSKGLGRDLLIFFVGIGLFVNVYASAKQIGEK